MHNTHSKGEGNYSEEPKVSAFYKCTVSWWPSG